jgi:hypothetical protein
MKNSYLTLVTALVFMSCSNSADVNQSFDVKGTFEYEIPNCDNTGNPEMNCTEIITFIDDSTVDVLIGGGDIMERTNYSISNNKIGIDGLHTDISFNIKNDSTLIRIQNGEIWTKSKY